MTFLKSSCSTVVSCEEQWVFQAFVNPASAIKNKSLTRTSNNKSDEKPLFLWWFQSTLSCCNSFSCPRSPLREARQVFSQIKTWGPKRAHGGLRVLWLAGGWPGLWGTVLWLLDPCSLCSVLSSHSLHWGSEPRGAAFIATALAPLSTAFYSVFVLFLISCRFLRTFQKYKNRIDWKGSTMCHSRIGLSGRKIVVSWLCFSEINTGETLKTE